MQLYWDKSAVSELRIKPYCPSHCKGLFCDLGCPAAAVLEPGPMMLGSCRILCHTQRPEEGWSGIWCSWVHQAASGHPSQILAQCRWRSAPRLELWSGAPGSVLHRLGGRPCETLWTPRFLTFTKWKDIPVFFDGQISWKYDLSYFVWTLFPCLLSLVTRDGFSVLFPRS